MLQRSLLAALNHVLAQESWARQRLRPFAGRRVRISLPPLLTIDLTVDQDGSFHRGGGELADVVIQLPENAPLRYLGNPQGALAAARLEGAADFAEALGFVFRNLRWDVEEDLARLVGDIPARRLVGLGRSAWDWQRDARERLLTNIGEYVGAERHALVSGTAMAAQRQAIADVATATDGLEARLARLR